MKSPTRFATSHPWLTVVSAARATELCVDKNTRWQMRGLISISDPPGDNRPKPALLDALLKEIGAYTCLDFHDVENSSDPELIRPTRDDISRILQFARRLYETPFPRTRLVIHCAAGRARSTAAAFIVLCDKLGPGREAEAMLELLTACERTPLPNTLMTQLADEVLGRSGRLHSAALAQNENPRDCECDVGKPVTGTALLNGIRRGEL